MAGAGVPALAQDGSTTVAQVSVVGTTGMQLLPGKEGLGAVNVMASSAYSLPSNDVLQSNVLSLSITTDQGYMAELSVPAGAWPSDVRTPPSITVYDAPGTMLSSVPDSMGTIAGPVLDLGPFGLTLNANARLGVPIGPSDCNMSATNACRVSVYSYTITTQSWIDISNNVSVDWQRGVVSTDVGVFTTFAAFTRSVSMTPNYNMLWVPPACGSSCLTGLVGGILFGTLVCTFSLAAYFQGIPPLPSWNSSKGEEMDPLVNGGKSSSSIGVDVVRRGGRKDGSNELSRRSSNRSLLGESNNQKGGQRDPARKSPVGDEPPKLEADLYKANRPKDERDMHEAAGRALRQALSSRRQTIGDPDGDGVEENGVSPEVEDALTGDRNSKQGMRPEHQKGESRVHEALNIAAHDKGPGRGDVEISDSGAGTTVPAPAIVPGAKGRGDMMC